MLSAAQQMSPTGQRSGVDLPSRDARLAYRSGKVGVTAGVAPGFVQGNLAILPEKLASSFHRFCQLNPKPCPIIGMSEVGDPRIPALGLDLDLRTDLLLSAKIAGKILVNRQIVKTDGILNQV